MKIRSCYSKTKREIQKLSWTLQVLKTDQRLCWLKTQLAKKSASSRCVAVPNWRKRQSQFQRSAWKSIGSLAGYFVLPLCSFCFSSNFLDGKFNFYLIFLVSNPQVSALESIITKGAKVAETDMLNLIELLMNQLLKLDGIVADGDVKLQRKMQVFSIYISQFHLFNLH